MGKCSKRIPNVLSIAGVDPSGGAGLLADIKTISACGAYACGVVSALTAQSTQGVFGISAVSPDFVTQQLDVLFSDVEIDAVKIGMLSDVSTIEAVARTLLKYKPKAIVLDPVMVAKSGDRLLAQNALDALKEDLLPLVTIITPNIPEAIELLGIKGSEVKTISMLLTSLSSASWNKNASVLLKGGHMKGEASIDYLYKKDGTLYKYDTPRVFTRNTHGTGCALSSAIAAFIPQSDSIEEAIAKAKRFIFGAISNADRLNVGKGHGPTHIFWKTQV